MLRMDEFNKVRKEFFVNKKSIYKIAQEYNRSWATINSIVIIPEHKVELPPVSGAIAVLNNR